MSPILGLKEDVDGGYLLDSVYQDIASRLKKDKTVLSRVKKAFKNVFPDGHNSYSMLVLSHRTGSDDDFHFDCLYTGDAEPKKDNIRIATQYTPGYVQIPHHASDKNHNIKWYTHKPNVFASVGTKNRFHHPGTKAINDICSICPSIHLITESEKPFCVPDIIIP